MKKGLMHASAAIVGAQVFACLTAMAAVQYNLTITNGSGMPLSPAVVFVKNGDASAAKIGETPSAGLVKLCQTGNGTDRMNELKKMSGVSGVTQTTGPILPGETRTLTVSVKNPREQSIQLETMYGKTKDVCGVVSVGAHSLYGLKAHVASESQGTDEVIATGAFLDPVLPEYPAAANACEEATSAAGCLRELALPNTGAKKIRFFSGYLPSVVSHVEHQFGAEETQSLLIPTSGAIRVDVKLKHYKKATALGVSAQNDRNGAEYNLQNNVGLKGFDPVAVFPEGGGQPAQGSQQISVNHEGVIYFFASEANRDLFLQNPLKYEPTYGGWCAYAMASGSKVDIQPHLYTINGNRAHYFIAARAKRNFDADIAGHETRADQFWKEISGEEPRQ